MILDMVLLHHYNVGGHHQVGIDAAPVALGRAGLVIPQAAGECETKVLRRGRLCSCMSSAR